MKTRIMKATLAVAFIAVAGYTAYNSQKEEVTLSNLAMENVEALASQEGGLHIQCFSGLSGNAFLCKCGVCIWGYTGVSNRGTCY